MVRGSLLLCAGKPCFVMARYLSRADLSRIAGKYIDQYYTCFGISKDDPSPINLEQFASSVLGLNVKMLPLCSDGSILGLTVFQRCGFTVTLGDGTKLVEIFMPKDVVIDSALAADSCTGSEVLTSLQASKRAAPAFSLSVSRSPRISIPAKPSSGCG